MFESIKKQGGLRKKVAVALAAAASFYPIGDQVTKPTTLKPTLKPISRKASSVEKPNMDTLETSYGHLRYQDIQQEKLVSIGNGKFLNRAAVTDYFAMLESAKKDGINLFPVSAFRSHSDQKNNFYGKMSARGTTAEVMSKSVAPPGYSEHHTGDAIDFNSLEQTFENTKEFKWMAENSAKYNFEISFTKNNPQGVMYEPWHWRWVGDSEAKHNLYRDKAYIVKGPNGTYIRDLASDNKGKK